ncbi:restriction endonuclease [Streptomyces sp. NPDC087270]|uniref:restriction endonuclease n=1 Tax=Streptomyces sp. NPDC087270 TaxID=3365774 RepID=UPI0038016B29
MIIKTLGKIRPHRYANKDFRRWMGDAIGKATQDQLLASFIYTTEATYAQSILGILYEHVQDVSRERAEAKARQTAALADTPKPIADLCRAAACQLVEGLADELTEAEQALDEARAAFKKMKDTFGDPAVRRHRQTAKSSEPSPFETMMPLWSQYSDAADRVAELLNADAEELHHVAMLDAHRMAFVRSEASMTLEQIHALHHSEFEQLAADLVRRDGYRVTRSGGGAGDLGADVIAESPQGEIVVIQCKHRASAGSGAIGSPDLQRLNGTARPVHNADLVIAMTNGTFSLPARRFADSQKIHLVEAQKLERWATWGQPLSEVLELI